MAKPRATGTESAHPERSPNGVNLTEATLLPKASECKLLKLEGE
jgi:hypothetical protein